MMKLMKKIKKLHHKKIKSLKKKWQKKKHRKIIQQINLNK